MSRLQWLDDDAPFTDTSAPCESTHPVAEALLIVFLFLPVVWLTLAVVESFR